MKVSDDIDAADTSTTVHNRTLSDRSLCTIAHCLIVLGFATPYRLYLSNAACMFSVLRAKDSVAGRTHGVVFCKD